MDNKTRAGKIESLLVLSRLRDIALEMKEGEVSRVARIQTALENLAPGVYLVGPGPYTQGIYLLSRDQVLIGRIATPFEEVSDLRVDILVNDAIEFCPREVSRVHCAIARREVNGRDEYYLSDLASTCGTFHNGVRIDSSISVSAGGVALNSQALTDGDVVSLGASGINSFLFVDLRR